MPKFLDKILNFLKRNDLKKLEESFVTFKDRSLQEYFMKKFKKEKILKKDLCLLKNISYSGNGQEIFQDDIDKLSKYCDLSEGQLFLDNINISGISFEDLKVKELVLQRTIVEDTKFPSKEILKSLGVKNSVGINFDDFNEYELENLFLSQMNIADFEIAKKFKNYLTRLSIFDEPLESLEGIEEFSKLKELSLAYTNIGIDSKDEIVKLREKGINVELLGTPLEDEINRLYKLKKEKEEQERIEQEGLIELDEEFVKLINKSGIFGLVPETRKITKKDIERLNTRAKDENIDLSIPSDFSQEYLKMNLSKQANFRKLSINIGKGDKNFNIEEFSMKRGVSSLLELEIDTPTSINNQPQEYLSSRYGITYNFDNTIYHYDDIKKLQEGIDDLIVDYKNREKDLDLVKDLYKHLKDNIKVRTPKILDRQRVKSMNGTEMGVVEIVEDVKPLRKLEYILKNKETDNFGLRNIMYHSLLSLGFDSDIQFPDLEYNLPNKKVKSSNINLIINNNEYSLDLDENDYMLIINDETRDKEQVNYKGENIIQKEEAYMEK